ncbi:hypothetical protein G7K_0087-t1 [Saitoella complicata NRRL Y-17804]|uniref:Uncharacterized protein n=1 Tax=Saitoella complicata (strain BCRC 22490 / CBS 7301 / JCM 7358 / NBRC 10748 / NRRL Y-17804) TaxID=698492 RepID=A0A0E9N7P6_SAICN|nr:hypothetical protein G7K_0087-t1 [Saitoella complicata NRRL Y-17804]
MHQCSDQEQYVDVVLDWQEEGRRLQGPEVEGDSNRATEGTRSSYGRRCRSETKSIRSERPVLKDMGGSNCVTRKRTFAARSWIPERSWWSRRTETI